MASIYFSAGSSPPLPLYLGGMNFWNHSSMHKIMRRTVRGTTRIETKFPVLGGVVLRDSKFESGPLIMAQGTRGGEKMAEIQGQEMGFPVVKAGFVRGDVFG